MTETTERETWWDRLSPEERKRRSKILSELRLKEWKNDSERRIKTGKELAKNSKLRWNDKKKREEILQKQKEGLDKVRHRTRVLLGLEEESK